MSGGPVRKIDAVVRAMPPLRHKVGDEFDFEKSEVVGWLWEQPEVRQYLFGRMKTLGLIVYDPESGTWAGCPGATATERAAGRPKEPPEGVRAAQAREISRSVILYLKRATPIEPMAFSRLHRALLMTVNVTKAGLEQVLLDMVNDGMVVRGPFGYYLPADALQSESLDLA